MRFGITATRALNDVGRSNIVTLLSLLDPERDSLILGGCTGGDAFAGSVALTMGLKAHVVLLANARQVDPEWNAYATTWEVQPTPRLRNEKIVDLSDQVWAFPNHATQKEDPRSGTWMTINIAKRSDKLASVKPQHPKAPTDVDLTPHPTR